MVTKDIVYNRLTKQFALVKEFTNNFTKGVRTGAGLWPEGEYILLTPEHRKKFEEYVNNLITSNESWNRPSKDWVEWVFEEVPSSEGLSYGFNESNIEKKERTETLAEQRLREEYEKMKKCAVHDPGSENRAKIDESQYSTPASVGMHRGRSVNSLVDDYEQKHGGSNSVATSIKPAEALDLAIKRTLASGAPINNMGFYDEINWHLKTLGNPAQLPIAIKEH